jgi:hypothetical protein
MEKARSSVFTRTREVPVRELPLGDPKEPPRLAPRRVSPRSERIRERLRRWLDEEL